MDPEPEPTAAIQRHLNHSASGTGWLGMSELPSGGEILLGAQGVLGLPPNIVDGSWPSKEAYLEAHYEILRREGIEGLRYSVQCYQKDPEMEDNQNTCVYTNVHVQAYLMTRIGAAAHISFKTTRARQKIKWLLSRRLTPGTVVAISTAKDNFNSICKIAIVAQRPFVSGLDMNPPEIDIFWARPDDAVFDPSEALVMLESRSGYFEAVRHALVGLQHAASEQSPLFKYVLGWSTNGGDSAPKRVRDNPVADLRSLANVSMEVSAKSKEMFQLKDSLRRHNVLSSFPPAINKITTLDESQLEAVKNMISQEFTIVQGPPGTGKTFTSISALRVLLANRRSGDPPFVISAQTNHALDQILGFCQDEGARILRLGGRSESESIKQRTVFNLRKSQGGRPDPKFRQQDDRRRGIIRKLRTMVARVFSDELIRPRDLLDQKIITQEQFDSLDAELWVRPSMNVGGIHRGKDQPAGLLALWLGGKSVVPTLEADSVTSDFSWEEEFDAEEDLGVEVDDELDRVLFSEDDDDRLKGEWIRLSQKWTVLTEAKDRRGWHAAVAKALDEKQDLHDISPMVRGGVYQLMKSRLMQVLLPQMQGLLTENDECCREMKANRWRNDYQLTQESAIDIVGCTTTGLSKYRGLLVAMEPRVLLIEEAAETREANIASAIFPSLQQLILVGDHQQLTPRCDQASLGGKPFYLKVSMFERLVHLNFEYTMLNKQRRMHPDIRKILEPFYEGLQDHEVVLTQRPPVPGMGENNSWFFRHRWPEQTDQEHSKFNVLEAEMAVKFAIFLTQNGIDQSKITILTFYNGQRKKIMQTLRRETALVNTGKLKVFTVDSYQGEENDVVLLSLVRSPPTPKTRFSLGFLDDQHRAVVAISRARRGFYVFGDVVNLLRATFDGFETWGRIWNGFVGPHFKGKIRANSEKGIPGICENHGNKIWFNHPRDFIGNAGGCALPCQATLPCGHRCQLRCHVTDHAQVACLVECKKMLSCGHRCTHGCTDKCYCHCTTFEGFEKGAPTAAPINGVPEAAPAKDSAPKSRPAKDSTSKSRPRHAGNAAARRRDGHVGNVARNQPQAINLQEWRAFAQVESAAIPVSTVAEQLESTAIADPVSAVALTTVSQRAIPHRGGAIRILVREKLVGRPAQEKDSSAQPQIREQPGRATGHTTTMATPQRGEKPRNLDLPIQEVTTTAEDKSDWLIDFAD